MFYVTMKIDIIWNREEMVLATSSRVTVRCLVI